MILHGYIIVMLNNNAIINYKEYSKITFPLLLSEIV